MRRSVNYDPNLRLEGYRPGRTRVNYNKYAINLLDKQIDAMEEDREEKGMSMIAYYLMVFYQTKLKPIICVLIACLPMMLIRGVDHLLVLLVSIVVSVIVAAILP